MDKLAKWLLPVLAVVCLVGAALLLPATARASTTFYVSRSGNNANGQSWATAWNELDQIQWSLVQPGDTILIDGGSVACNYPVEVTGSSNTPQPAGCGMVYRSTLSINAGGTATAPITIRLASEPGRNGTARFFGGRSTPLPYCGQSGYNWQPGNNEGIYVSARAYVVVDGSHWGGIMVYGNVYGIHLSHNVPRSSQHHLTFRNIEVFDNGTGSGGEPNEDGVQPNGRDLYFERMVVHDNGQDAFQTGYGTSAEALTFRRVWLYNQRPHPAQPTEPFNYCTHSDGLQIYNGGEIHGVTVEDSIIGPGFMQGFILGYMGTPALATVHDVTIRNTLMVSHHGDSSNAGLVTNEDDPTNYELDHVTVFRDVGATWNNVYIRGYGHEARDSVFHGGMQVTIAGGPVVSNNTCWETNNPNGVCTRTANPMFVDSTFAGVGTGYADFDFTIQNPSIPAGSGTSITSVAVLFGDSPPPPTPPPPSPTTTRTPPPTPTRTPPPPTPTRTPPPPTPTLPPPTPTVGPGGIVVDDSGAGFATTHAQDAWGSFQDAAGQHFGGGHHYNRLTGSGQDVATWSFTVPRPGRYAVYAWWWAGSWRPADVPYVVRHRNGTTTVSMNQQIDGGQWNLVGTFRFRARGTVAVNDSASSGRDIVADAIQVVYVGP